MLTALYLCQQIILWLYLQFLCCIQSIFLLLFLYIIIVFLTIRSNYDDPLNRKDICLNTFIKIVQN